VVRCILGLRREPLQRRIPVVLAGDYNVMPTELAVYKPERWVG
jgi:exodeoxyribonuclease-3